MGPALAEKGVLRLRITMETGGAQAHHSRVQSPFPGRRRPSLRTCNWPHNTQAQQPLRLAEVMATCRRETVSHSASTQQPWRYAAVLLSSLPVPLLKVLKLLTCIQYRS